jgi:hypothetical protein
LPNFARGVVVGVGVGVGVGVMDGTGATVVLGAGVALLGLYADWIKPGGMPPSPKEAPQVFVAYVLISFERALGWFWLMMVYAPFMQFVQTTLEGKPAPTLLTIAEMLSSLKFNVPSTASMFFRVCVRQLVAPSLRHTTFLKVA